MLTPDEIRKAILSLVQDEYEGEELADIQKKHSDKIKRISLDLLALKYLKEAHIPNEYCVYSEEDPAGTYRGRRLFDLKAVMVAREEDTTFATESINITVSDELWLMENSDFVFVECTKMEILESQTHQVVEQRLFQFFPFEKDRLAWPFGVVEVICALVNACAIMETELKASREGF